LTVKKPGKNDAQKGSCPFEQLGKIHSGRTQDCIDTITKHSLESIAIHAMFPFKMTNSRLYGRFSF
jgi:hypothetical protein